MKISSNICQNKQCLYSKAQYPDSVLQKAIFYDPIQIHRKHIYVPSSLKRNSAEYIYKNTLEGKSGNIDCRMTHLAAVPSPLQQDT